MDSTHAKKTKKAGSKEKKSPTRSRSRSRGPSGGISRRAEFWRRLKDKEDKLEQRFLERMETLEMKFESRTNDLENRFKAKILELEQRFEDECWTASHVMDKVTMIDQQQWDTRLRVYDLQYWRRDLFRLGRNKYTLAPGNDDTSGTRDTPREVGPVRQDNLMSRYH